MKEKISPETLAIHQNYRGDETNSVVRPIHMNTAYYFDDADHGANLFDLQVGGNIYTRLTNPTNDALGTLVSDLEGGVGGLAVASGAAALLTVVMTICKAGDHIVSSKSIYGGSHSLLENTFSLYDVKTTFVDQESSYEDLSAAVKPNTKLIFAEVIGNPKVDVLDIVKFSKLAREHNIPLVIDSTFTPPNLFRAKDHGANIIIHSATKYLGGHGNALGGIVVDCGNFDWTSGKFADFNSPSPAYHGLNFYETFGVQAFIYKARAHILRDTGATLSPLNAFLIMQGIQTLWIRLDHLSKNTLLLAKWLENHPKVDWVSYPLLESSPNYDRAKQYLSGGGGILAFGVKGDSDDCKQFVNRLKLAIHAVNVGDVRTIVSHPASTTHRQTPTEELIEAGITENFIRVSLGLENLEDIKADLNQALGGK